MWFLPTYGRPQSFDRLLHSTGGPLNFDQLHVLLTEDAPRRDEYKVWPYEKHVVPANSLGDVLRWILPNFPNEKNYGLITDDFILVARGWWNVLEEAAGDRFIATSFAAGYS